MTSKRGAGRPPGSRNKVDVHLDVQRALKSGKTLTEVKEWIEDYIKTLITAKEDPKHIIALFKTDIQLIQYLQGVEIKRQESEGSEDSTKLKSVDGNDELVGQIFQFGKKQEQS